MKVISSFLAFCFIVQIAWAHHTIKGTVLSAEDRTPLTGAFVGIVGTSKGTITNEFGQFELVIEDPAVTLTISFLGFSEKTIEVDEHSGSIVILLETAAIELAQLRISASEMNSVNTISKLDLKLRPFNSSQEVLRIVPGLFIAQHAGGGKAEQIFLRGFDLDHGTDINITVDGLPVNMVSHAHGQGYADLHFLIPELINVVDFGKGPYYTERGNLNTAGYVGFTTKSTLNKQILKIEAGRYNTLRTVGMFNLLGEDLALKGHNAIAAVEYNMTNGPFEIPQNFNRLNLFAKYTGQFNANNSLTIQLMRMTSKWDASGQIPQRAVDSGEITRFGSIDPTEGGLTSRTDASLKLISRLPSGWIFENQLFMTSYDFELYSNFTFFLNNPEYGDQIRQKEKRNITGLNGVLSKTSGLGNNSLTTKIGYGFKIRRYQ
ncbi:MAG: TonB-dependent receptor [Cyclobacteriaceae bacterium]|nr:TonB-dependent receptor [Cyclobacteriaceae bacterium]